VICSVDRTNGQRPSCVQCCLLRFLNFPFAGPTLLGGPNRVSAALISRPVFWVLSLHLKPRHHLQGSLGIAVLCHRPYISFRSPVNSYPANVENMVSSKWCQQLQMGIDFVLKGLNNPAIKIQQHPEYTRPTYVLKKTRLRGGRLTNRVAVRGSCKRDFSLFRKARPALRRTPPTPPQTIGIRGSLLRAKRPLCDVD
jgi:hypothetical protein